MIRVRIGVNDAPSLAMLTIVNDRTGATGEPFDGIGSYDVRLYDLTGATAELRTRVEKFDRSRGAVALVRDALLALDHLDADGDA